MLRDYLSMQLFSIECGLMATSMPIELGDQHCWLWARPRILISDGDGHRLAMDWNRQGAMKPCFRHWNVISKDESLGRLEHAPGEYVDITKAESISTSAAPAFVGCRIDVFIDEVTIVK